MIKTVNDAIDGYLRDMQTALALVDQESVETTIACLYRTWEQGRRVFVLGNGGSASTASHVANDFAKATIVPGKPRVKVISLSDNISVITAWANDSSYDVVFKEQLENLLEPGDAVIVISASGNSPNVVRAVEFARERHAVTIAWTGRTGGRLKDMVDCCVLAPTDDIGMIESVHLVIDHLVTDRLRQRIATSGSRASDVRDEEAVSALSA